MTCDKGSSYGRGCRCVDCKATNAARHRKARKERKSRRANAQYKHGAGAYTNWGCRCEVCVEANSKAMAPVHQKYQQSNQGKINDRVRAKYASRPDHDYERSRSKNYREKVQTKTRPLAHRWGYEWTGPELELAARDDLTSVQIALMIGRTAYAVRTMQHYVRVDPRKANLAGLSAG